MKTEFEKMRSGEFYSLADPEVAESLRHGKERSARLRTMTIYSPGYRDAIEALIPGLPATATVMPPVFCDHGNGLHIGEHTFINSGCTFLDGADIFIGRHVLIGPNCQFYTPNHPMDYRLRRDDVETCHPIRIGDDSWLGGGVVVLPGVTIGARCVIGAGSVVTRDIPDDSVAVGNPARVVRRLATPSGPASEA